MNSDEVNALAGASEILWAAVKSVLTAIKTVVAQHNS